MSDWASAIAQRAEMKAATLKLYDAYANDGFLHKEIIVLMEFALIHQHGKGADLLIPLIELWIQQERTGGGSGVSNQVDALREATHTYPGIPRDKLIDSLTTALQFMKQQHEALKMMLRSCMIRPLTSAGEHAINAAADLITTYEEATK